MPKRHGSVDGYRYGFQGQEKDDEIKGEGNSLNYKFRMHDPRVGRFFARDPLEKSYPWYSPYQFSGNTPIMSIELEGMEPRVSNGVLVGYTIQKNQGPTQIVNDINDPETQKKFGYTLVKPLKFETFVKHYQAVFTSSRHGNIPNSQLLNKEYDGYRHMNLNEGQFFKKLYEITESKLPEYESNHNPKVWFSQYKPNAIERFKEQSLVTEMAYEFGNSFYLAAQAIDGDLLGKDYINPLTGSRAFTNLDGSVHYEAPVVEFATTAMPFLAEVKLLAPAKVLNTAQFSTKFSGTSILKGSAKSRGLRNRIYNQGVRLYNLSLPVTNSLLDPFNIIPELAPDNKDENEDSGNNN